MNTDEIVRAGRLKEIATRHEAATRGPWENTSGEFITSVTPIGSMAICRVNRPVGVRWAPDGTGRTYSCGAGSEQPNKEFIAHAREDIPFLLDEVESLQAKNQQLRQWVNDLQSGMYVNCVYCGHRYGPAEATPVSMADALKAHIEQCPEHPMSHLKAKLTASQRREKAAAEDLEFIMRHTGERGVCKKCVHNCIINSRVKPKCCDAKWRGPQEAGEGANEQV